MNIGLIISIAFLISGIIYAIYMLRSMLKDPEWFKAAPGKLGVIMGFEVIIFILCTIGVSDFLLNTILCQRLKLAEPKTQPDCNICAGVVPGALIAFLYLRNTDIVDGKILAIFILCLVPGCLLGSKLVGRMNGDFIRRAMILFLSITLIFLIIRTLANPEAATANTLKGWKLAIIGVEAFCAGFISMLGIPAKPMTATTALLLGLSPVTTLAITLGAVPWTCVAGGINTAPRKRYNPKLVFSSIAAGCPAAALGCFAAISINAEILNIIVLAVLLTAIASLVRK